MKYFLPKTGLKAIDRAVEALFNRLKARFLGQRKEPKQIRFGVYDQPVKVKDDLTIPGIFDEAARSESVKPNEQLKSALASSIEQYLDAHQELAKAKIKSTVQTFLTESEMSKKKPNVEKILGQQLGDVFTKVNSDVQKVVDNEMNKAKNVSTLDGIIKRGLSLGIEDSTVAFLGPLDQYTCDDCVRLFFMPDRITPRVWKVSELNHGYGKHNATVPSVGGQHPFCRHSLVTMRPGFGFKGGKIGYIEPGYDVYEDQRS